MHTRVYARGPDGLHVGPTPRTRARRHARGQRRPRACLVVYVRIKGLTRMFKGLGANNTPHPTSLCPKRRPPSPQQPIFGTSYRGDLHFGRYATSNKQLTNVRRGNCIIRAATRRRYTARQLVMLQIPHRHRSGGRRIASKTGAVPVAAKKLAQRAPSEAFPRKNSPSKHKNAKCGVF